MNVVIHDAMSLINLSERNNGEDTAVMTGANTYKIVPFRSIDHSNVLNEHISRLKDGQSDGPEEGRVGGTATL